MPDSKIDRIDNDPFASRRQPQQGERQPSEPKDNDGAAQAPAASHRSPSQPERDSKDPADGLMEGGD